MKTFLKKFLNGIYIWAWFLTVFIWYLFVTANWQNTLPSGWTDTDLFINWTWNLTSDKRNSLVNKNKRIICSKSASWETNVTNTSKVVTFNASDCWGSLPDSSYMWLANTINFCWTSSSLAIWSNNVNVRLISYCWWYSVTVMYVKK